MCGGGGGHNSGETERRKKFGESYENVPRSNHSSG